MSTEECNSDEDCTAINITVMNIVFLIFAASSVAGSTWTWICTEIQQAAHGKRCNKCAQQDQEMLFINNSECLKAVSLPYILKHLPRQIFGFSSDFFFQTSWQDHPRELQKFESSLFENMCTFKDHLCFPECSPCPTSSLCICKLQKAP